MLSDDSLRKDYDRSLKFGAGGGTGTGGSSVHGNFERRRDPFEQFNTVFKTDPFFADAFRDMNELFQARFADGNTTNDGAKGNEVACDNEGGGWLWNTVKNWLPSCNIEVSTTTTSLQGGTTQTRSSYGSIRAGGGKSHTYTSQSTRTVIQNGQRITIQSLEKDGNKIQENYAGTRLIERTINGVKENVGQTDVGRL